MSLFKRFHLLVVALLACGLLAAGCGDDDDDEGNADDSPPAAQSEDGGGDADAESEAPADDAGAAGGDVDAAVEQAVESCKQSVGAAPQLSADVIADLEEICEEAATGDADAVAQASKDVCIKIVEETVPEGAARDQALDACEQATPTP
ncbi:MAG: hypothetical protein WD844_07370 [Thermoleophilaceae bacterium]